MSLRRLFHRRRELPFADYGYEVREFDLPHDGACNSPNGSTRTTCRS